MDCQITISVRKNEAESVFESFNHLFEINIETL